jgi:hypothetical protein
MSQKTFLLNAPPAIKNQLCGVPQNTANTQLTTCNSHFTVSK